MDLLCKRSLFTAASFIEFFFTFHPFCKFISYCEVLKRDSAMEIDSSSQGPGALFSSILPLTVLVILEKINKRCSVLENELDKLMEERVSVTG